MAFQLFSQKDNRWREYLNPLRGLTLPRLLGLLDAGERGQYADLQWFYYYMERSDPVIFSVIQRRKAALLDSDWDIRRVAANDEGAGGLVQGSGGIPRRVSRTQRNDDVLAQEQVACLREVYDGIDNFRDALGYLFTGFFRGYAHVEKHFDEQGCISRLEPVEQWFWVRDGMFGDWEYNENAVSGRSRGIPVTRENFVIHESVALNRMLAPLYLARGLNLKNWASYLEIFGVPSVFLVGPPNSPSEKEADYQKIASDLIGDGRGYLPNGSDLKYVNAGGGKPPFPDHVAYIDRTILMVVTGGLLTMTAESGTGTLAGNAHQQSFLQIARADTAALSEVLQRSIDDAALAENFPGQPALAYFEFAPSDADKVSRVIQDAATLASVGLQVDPAEISEKSGYRLAPAGAAAPVNSGQ